MPCAIIIIDKHKSIIIIMMIFEQKKITSYWCLMIFMWPEKQKQEAETKKAWLREILIIIISNFFSVSILVESLNVSIAIWLSQCSYFSVVRVFLQFVFIARAKKKCLSINSCVCVCDSNDYYHHNHHYYIFFEMNWSLIPQWTNWKAVNFY